MASQKQTEFGALLKRARTQAGMSRDQMARRVGLDASHLFRIEKGGRNPSRDSALALALALDLDDEQVNRLMVAAGYAPIPALGAIRKTIRAQGGVRTCGSASDSTSGPRVSRSWGASAAARRLEAVGLTEVNVARLLDAMASVGLAAQAEAAEAVAGAFRRVTEALESPVRAAVVPAAGGQHRLLAPHITQQLLMGVIQEAALSGLRDIVLVLAPGGEVFFQPLKEALHLALAPMVSLHYVEQPRPEGLGAAVLLAEKWVGHAPFAVLLPDDVVREHSGRVLTRELRRMVGAIKELEKDASLVAVASVPRSRLTRCGAARLAARPAQGRIFPVLELVEKPGPAAPIAGARNVRGIVGRYVLEPGIFEALRELRQRSAAQLELTDALALVLARGAKVYAYEIEAKRDDIGAVLAEAQGLIASGS